LAIGAFHSYLFIVPVYLLISFFSGVISLAFLLAACSHLILDALTPEGITPFYPLKYRIKGVIKTNSTLEKIFIIFLLIVLAIRLLALS
jgi:membrane-bound metal-dependent hydrolase YbcI (DUF457 family)